MATVASIRAALFAIVERISGHAQVVWRDQADPHIDPETNTIVRLHLRSFNGVATPETRKREVTVLGETTIASDVVDHKTFFLVVLVECLDQETTAHDVAERIRTRLYRPYAKKAMRAANVAVQLVGASTDLPTKYDGSVVSASAFDVRMATVMVDTQEAFDAELEGDEVTDAVTWIEHVVIGATVDGESAGEQTVSLPEE